MRMIAILGASGSIGGELVKQLIARNEPVRLVSRSPKLVPGAAEAVAADLSIFGGALNAISGCRIAVLLAGLKYDLRVAMTNRDHVRRVSEPGAVLIRDFKGKRI